MMLVGTLALQAGTATLQWDYNFTDSPDVNLFKVYCAPGTNVTWAVGNTNATKTVLMPYTGSGSVSNITLMVGGLASGAWTFTVTAIGNGGAESANATTAYGTNVWTITRPGNPTILKLAVP